MGTTDWLPLPTVRSRVADVLVGTGAYPTDCVGLLPLACDIPRQIGDDLEQNFACHCDVFVWQIAEP